MKKMNLTKWMMMEMLPMNMAAAKYTVGQNLTEVQAREIVQMIAHSVDFQMDKPAARKYLNRIGSPYRDFVVCITLLIIAGESNPKWCDAIWGVMDSDLRFACHNVMLGKMLGA